MGLPAERVIPLSVDTPHVIDGVTVTLMDANHCPGACMMLFKVATKPQVLLSVQQSPCSSLASGSVNVGMLIMAGLTSLWVVCDLPKQLKLTFNCVPTRQQTCQA